MKTVHNRNIYMKTLKDILVVIYCLTNEKKKLYFHSLINLFKPDREARTKSLTVYSYENIYNNISSSASL